MIASFGVRVAGGASAGASGVAAAGVFIKYLD